MINFKDLQEVYSYTRRYYFLFDYKSLQDENFKLYYNNLRDNFAKTAYLFIKDRIELNKDYKLDYLNDLIKLA